ncbi:MAG: hypothetical protein GQ574_04225 [Crocinitomix sp.]|nr:hypothetical protein [Crocinitomix sp.]
MNSTTNNKFNWVIATDYSIVHALLLESDQYNATPNSKIPYRAIETTIKHVKEGRVHILLSENELVGMFTLNIASIGIRDKALYPQAIKPAYLSRLAVYPKWLEKEPFIGMQCVRKAISIAKNVNCDCIRSEINPDILGVKRMLGMLDFKVLGEKTAKKHNPIQYLQKKL